MIVYYYDVRFEVDGVMRLWVVFKGFLFDFVAKRFVVEVGDYELVYNDFEGVFGDGGVIIWDCGIYEQGGRVLWLEVFECGYVVFVLHGEKLCGGFALQRTCFGDKLQWLFVKCCDDEVCFGLDVVVECFESVVSGRMLDQLFG